MFMWYRSQNLDWTINGLPNKSKIPPQIQAILHDLLELELTKNYEQASNLNKILIQFKFFSVWKTISFIKNEEKKKENKKFNLHKHLLHHNASDPKGRVYPLKNPFSPFYDIHYLRGEKKKSSAIQK